MGTGTGGGKSEQNPVTTSSTNNIQKTTNNVDNSIHTSDFGAITSAENIARDSIAVVDAQSKRNTELASDVTSGVTDFAKGIVNSSFTFARDENDSSLNFARGLQDNALEGIFHLAEGNAASLNSTVKAINDIGTQRNTSADQRVQDLATTSLKIGLGMVALIAAVIIFGNHHKAA